MSIDVGGRRAECAAIKELDKAHAALQQPPGQQAIAAEACRHWIVEPVQPPGCRRLAFKPDGLGNAGLHLGSQLISAHASQESAVSRVLGAVLPIQMRQHVQTCPAFTGNYLGRSVPEWDWLVTVGSKG